MDWTTFHDGSIANLVARRSIEPHHETNNSLQMHSSLVRRLSFERELQGHQGCVNTIAWNSNGSLLISGSDDTRINIWSYSSRSLLQSVETGHSTNIFCTKFVPETSDELVVSGAGDAEVRLFNLSRLRGNGLEQNIIDPLAVFQCHARRVKKLAVEVGNPNVVWSASEDGTLRQHDFREGASCPPAGSSSHECRNILLDLRRGAKKSLSDPPKQILQLKSCDLSVTRPHLLLVGGSDSFARLYDRRMLPSLSSSQKRLPAPPCVSYMCPMHLSVQGRSSPHLTHVTFSPNSEEVLLSYSGEHVYLMDVNPADGGCTRYTSGDAAKLTSFIPVFNEEELQSSVQHIYSNRSGLKGHVASMLERCRKLIQFAGKSLIEKEKSYYYGIEACNEVLDGCGPKIGRSLMLECLCIRAALLLKRKWKNDAHLAIRDCYSARKIDPSCVRPLLCMSEALLQLGQHKEALDYANSARSLAPYDSEVIEKVEHIKGVVAAAEAEKVNKTVNGGTNAESQSARLLALSDILYRSEGNSDTSQEGPRSDREDSDYDDELELNFETSMAAGGHEVESNSLDGSLNLLTHGRPDYSTESGHVNGSSESPTSPTENDKFQLEAAIDMKQRYVGHCNAGTDIKQASFLGQKGDYVASGSDDGRWFIWEKKTGRLVKMLSGDGAVVNCIQCHPFDSVVATSGIDDTIKIWTPTAPVPSVVASSSAGPERADVIEVMENNQRELRRRQTAVLPLEILERFRMHEFAEGGLHPFECTQS